MPITSLAPKPFENKTEFETIPEDVYQVQITDIKEKLKAPYQAPAGTEATEPFYGFEFTILDEGKFRGRKLWKDVKPVLPFAKPGSKEPWLHKIIAAVHGKALTFAEAESYGVEQLNALIGKQLRVLVKNSPPKADGKVFSNLESVMHTKNQMPAWEPKSEKKESTIGKRMDEEVPSIQIEDSDMPF